MPLFLRASTRRRKRFLAWGLVCIGLAAALLALHRAREETWADLRLRIRAAADRHGLDPVLVEAVVEAESGGNTEAVSPAKAYGLMQVRLPTALDMAGRNVGIDELFDPRINLDLGCKYLRLMLDRYGGDRRLALMAYNAGPGNVDKWRKKSRDPDEILAKHAFGQTRAYVRRVLERTRELKEG